MVPTRELYWNIHYHWLMYPFMLISLVAFVYGFYKHYQLWRIGKPLDRNDRVWMRVKSLLLYGIGHKRIVRENYPGVMHLAIFWGFAVLFAGTLVVALQADFHIPVLYGNFYLVLSLLCDIFGFAAIIGILMGMVRRYRIKPERLDNTPDDAFALVLILVILITGFLLEGLRIAASQDPWAMWSPFGYVFAKFFTGLSAAASIPIYQGLWWFHMLLAFVFIGYLPYGKLLHIITSPLNQYFQKLEPPGALSLLDLEDEKAEQFGVSTIQDFNWKQLMDTDACTRCGRCQDHCPAYQTHKPLSPKEVTQSLKKALQHEGRKPTQATGLDESPSLIGEVLKHETIWACTTCRACEESCPVFVEHVDRMIDLRRHLVLMESNFPQELQNVFVNLEVNSNPWGVGWNNRADWAQSLNVQTLRENADVDYLYWVGCAGSYEDRNKKVTVAVTKLLQNAGIRFGILGKEEKCCGETARRLGHEYLYQSLAQENLATFNNYGVKKIITQCPHCYNTLKNEYPQLGGSFEVIHHTQLLSDLVKKGKLELSKLDARVTFHDSCYLGRYNGIYDPPRETLNAIPGVTVVEMKQCKDQAFCCGAGGGRMWIDEPAGSRINEKRSEEVMETKADIVVTACPYCSVMIGDGLKALENNEIRVMDLAEVITEAIH